MLNDKEDRVKTLHFEDIKENTGESLLDISEDAVKNNTGKHKETDTNNARDVRTVMGISWDMENMSLYRYILL